MNFDQIFAEYYTLYRGQASKIPVYGDREYAVAIPLANAAIKKWERADGQLWRELEVPLSADATAPKTIVNATLTYAAPTNMRKPPASIQISGTGSSWDIPVIDPQWAAQYAGQSVAWFTGGAQTGYVLHLPLGVTQQYGTYTMENINTKNATLLPISSTPAAIIPDMSDPTFIIQDMLASRAQQARNGFVFKAAKAESTAALANMKIENNSGTYGNTQTFAGQGSGWGRPSNFGDIRL